MIQTQELRYNVSRTILLWAWNTFQPGIVASSSFQTQSVALLHLISQVCPEMEVIFIDTGYHFPETLAFRDALQRQFGLSVWTLFPDSHHSPPAGRHAPLYRRNPGLCCHLNKVTPMKEAVSQKNAWVIGLRRDQTPLRKHLCSVEYPCHEPVRIYPLVEWTYRDLLDYIEYYHLPVHPLFEQGYHSIGCAPCTTPVVDGNDERGGRWPDLAKTECGLHSPLSL